MINRILIIDDDQDTAPALESILSQRGFTVQKLTCGAEVIEEAFPIPDVSFIDNLMPTIDGIGLCKFLKIKEITKTIPVIIISDDDRVYNKAERAGASFF